MRPVMLYHCNLSKEGGGGIEYKEGGGGALNIKRGGGGI